MLHLAPHGLPSKSVSFSLRGDHGQIAVAEEEQVARVIENGRHVAGDEVFVLAQADHGRRAIARGDDFVRLVGGDHRQAKTPVSRFTRLAHRFFHEIVLAVVCRL